MTILDNDMVRAMQADRVGASLRNEAMLQARGAVESHERAVGHNHRAPVEFIAVLIGRVSPLLERSSGRFSRA